MMLIRLLSLIVPVALIIFAIESSYAPSKPSRLFHKWKVVEVTHNDGTVDYTVKINGFLGMPFLYQTMVEDMGLYSCALKGMSLSSAKEYVANKESKYLQDKNYNKIVNKTTLI